jgi:hypothetical protein
MSAREAYRSREDAIARAEDLIERFEAGPLTRRYPAMLRHRPKRR